MPRRDQPSRPVGDVGGESGRRRISRRRAIRNSAAVLGGAAGLLAGESAFGQASAVQTGTQTGRRFRAFMRFANSPRSSVEEVRMFALDENRVVVRTEASQCCYSIVGQALGTTQSPDTRILGHGGVGVVEAIGAKVRRVQVGDRVVVANTPYCGQCYMCLRGRADRCQMLPGYGNALVPIGELADGTRVVQHNNEGGFAELMIPYEWYCMPIFYDVSPVELSILGCVGACGLGTTFGVAPVEPGSDVAVLGCGPLGLSAVQGARIKGASQIIAVDPIRARRELALKLGATIALDPNVEGMNLVARIKDLCSGPTDRRFAGGRDTTVNPNALGPDYVIEAVGGNIVPPMGNAEAGPDPTGLLSLQQAWDLCSAAGHLMTVAIGHQGNFTLPGNQWSNGAKNHHPGNMNGVSTLRDMSRFARLTATGQYNAKALATATYPLDRTREAFRVVADRTTVAAVVVV
ncbi:MAG: alcohol dehydrogenase catalytic domain-containing protein [Acidobacteria bacterium]|nr:alcohol dehydrogenase catalytic domain-containing protein [Acidobacteriota bacterium]